MASKRAAGKEAAGICFAGTNYRKKETVIVVVFAGISSMSRPCPSLDLSEPYAHRRNDFVSESGGNEAGGKSP